MFMNVIMGILWCIIGMPNMKMINIMVIEILQKRSDFDISLLGILIEFA